jgi:PBSX family phage terminase large subunit
MGFSEKQMAYFANAHHRWNVKTGATRSGKTYMDYYVIPKRIRAVSGKDGKCIILGHTLATIRRNVIEPLQGVWGASLVSGINGNNICHMFGEPVECIGADKVTAVDRLRGMSVKYCYGDEVVTWHEDVFQMLKSRLDKGYSRFDGTCNPDAPQHWFHKFLFEGSEDKFVQEYTLYDNPYLDPDVLHALEQEYRGTVYFERFILGHWVAAQGLIYKSFADDARNGKTMYLTAAPQISRLFIGVDFGGSGSAHTFVATGTDRGYQHLYALLSERVECRDSKGNQIAIDPERLGIMFCDFVRRVTNRFQPPDAVFCDSAEQTLIIGLRSTARKQGLSWLRIYNAMKLPIIDRIRCTQRLIAQGRFFVMDGMCDSLCDALSTALWNPKNLTKDERLDNGTTDIDSLDAFEYSFEQDIAKLIKLE